MHLPTKPFGRALLVGLLATAIASGCGGEDGIRSAPGPASSSEPEKTAVADHDDEPSELEPLDNGLLIAASEAWTDDEQVAVWSGSGQAVIGESAAIDVDPPLGAQPRISRDGATLAWLAGGTSSVELWLVTGSDEPMRVGIVDGDDVLDVRSMDVSGDGRSLIVSTQGAGDDADQLWRVSVASGEMRRIDVPASDDFEYLDVATNSDGSIVAMTIREGTCDDREQDVCDSGLALLELGEDAEPARVKMVYSAAGSGPASNLHASTFSSDDELLLFASGEEGDAYGVSVKSIPVQQLLDEYDDIEPARYASALRDIRGMTLSPDGKMLAIATSDDGGGSLRVVSLEAAAPVASVGVPGLGTPIWVPAAPGEPKTAFAPSPDGAR